MRSLHLNIFNVFFVSLILLVSINLSGCAGFAEKKEKTAKELFNEGLEKFTAGRYRLAIESFNNLKDWYPFSIYAVEAELKTADAHFFIGEYIEAIFSYQDFERLHPSNEAIPYVIYQIGMCYMNQLNSNDRDQLPAHKAIENFERLTREHNNSKSAEDAKVHIVKCYKNIVDHELYIGKYYYRTKHYNAALARFMRIISDYPDIGGHQKAIEYISKCHLQLIINNQPININNNHFLYY